MKILVNLLQTTGTKGGIEVYARELYSAMKSVCGDEQFIGLASKELMRSGAPWFPGELVDSGVSGENRIEWAYGELFVVSRFASKLGVDLIHGPAMFSPFRSQVPIVTTMHDVLYFSRPELMRSKFLSVGVRMMERVAAAKSNTILTISSNSAREIREHLGVDEKKIKVIKLAPRFHDYSGQHQEKAAGLFFFASGQRSPYKDFSTILRAWARIPRDSRPKLVIAGSSSSDPLIPLRDELDLGKWVELRGWISDEEMHALFNSASGFIDSTLATGFSLPAVEAMAQAIPTILADTPVFREVGGPNANYFSAGDPDSLAETVTWIMKNPETSAKKALESQKSWGEDSWTRVASETLEVFRAIASG